MITQKYAVATIYTSGNVTENRLEIDFWTFEKVKKLFDNIIAKLDARNEIPYSQAKYYEGSQARRLCIAIADFEDFGYTIFENEGIKYSIKKIPS